MKLFQELINDALQNVDELFPWDLTEELESGINPILLDIREPYEYDCMHIKGSINVPRGILESACEYDYEETIPQLVAARNQGVIAICRSGNRSILATNTMQLMGFKNVRSLKTGLRGWNDYELPLIDIKGNTVDLDVADQYFLPKLKDSQLKPE